MAKAGSTASRLSPAREKLLLQESLLQARFIQTKIILQCRDAQALLAQPYIFKKKTFSYHLNTSSAFVGSAKDPPPSSNAKAHYQWTAVDLVIFDNRNELKY